MDLPTDVPTDALLDVVNGKFKSTGKLPMSIPASAPPECSRPPGQLEKFNYAYKDSKNSIYKFGFGLNYN